MTLLIREEDVQRLLTFEETIEAVENAYRQYGMGLAGGNSLIYGCPIIPRCEMRVKGIDLPHGAPEMRCVSQDMAYLKETGMVFLRWSFRLGDKRGGMSYLIDAENGEVLAIVKAANFESFMRTGSDGAVGAKYLSRKDSEVAGIIGTGRQGRSQLEALSKVRNLKRAFAYSGRRKDEKYAREMGRKLGIDVIACNGAEDVVRKADILITASRATKPIVNGEWVGEGLHISAIGADCPLKAELDASTLSKTDKLVIDYELALDVKDIRVPMEQGILTTESIYGNIGEVVAGVKPGRQTHSEITIYKCTGSCLAYVAINAHVYEKAKKMGLGIDTDSSFIDLVYS